MKRDEQDHNVSCEAVAIQGTICVVDMNLLNDTANCDAQRHETRDTVEAKHMWCEAWKAWIGRHDLNYVMPMNIFRSFCMFVNRIYSHVIEAKVIHRKTKRRNDRFRKAI
jgi:hypothetical protein